MSEFKFININERAYKYIRQFTIKTVNDALIEVVTNCIDAYNKKGVQLKNIDIEYYKPDTIVVRDYAIGLNGTDMEKCFLQVGNYTNVTDSRGFFSRGAKDISAIGNITFESIKDNKYTSVLLNSDAYGKVENFDILATDELKKSTKLYQNSGLVVTIKLLKNFIVQDPVQLGSSIEKISTLRDIMNDKNNTIIYTVYDEKKQNIFSKRLFYRYPPGDLLMDLEYVVPGYNLAKARFVAYKLEDSAPQPLKENEMEFGFLIKSNKTIYEVDTIDTRFRWNPYMNYVRGYVHCDYIHKLLIDYDNSGPTQENPLPIIDPSRLSGVNKQHPFITSLLAIPKVRLDQILRELNSHISARSIDLNDMNSLFDEMSKFGSDMLDNQDIQFTFVPSYDSQLAKAIENDRINYITSEKNYLYPGNYDTNQILTDETIKQKIEALGSNPDETVYIVDDQGNIIEIPIEPSVLNRGDITMDILNQLTDEQKSNLQNDPYIYSLNNNNLSKLYIFQKGNIERVTDPETANVIFKTNNFSISFINDINLNQRFTVEYSNGIQVKINIASESVSKYLVNTQTTFTNDPTNNFISNTNSSVKSLIFLKELMLDIFTTIIVDNDIINGKIVLDMDSYNNSKKILTYKNNVSYTLEPQIEQLFMPYVIKNAQTKLQTINGVLMDLTQVVRSVVDVSTVPELTQLKSLLGEILVSTIE